MRVNNVEHPCLCGTGSYCRRHQRYNLGKSGDDLVHRSRIVAVEAIPTSHACGGGVRIIRNATKE